MALSVEKENHRHQVVESYTLLILYLCRHFFEVKMALFGIQDYIFEALDIQLSIYTWDFPVYDVRCQRKDTTAIYLVSEGSLG